MNIEQQEAWMDENINMLLQRAVKHDISPYIVYAYLNGAAKGIGSNIDPELKRMMDDRLDEEFEGAMEQ